METGFGQYQCGRNLDRSAEMKKIFDHKRDFLLMNLGLIIVAAGVHFFKVPNRFAIGGTTGISILISNLFPMLNVGHVMLMLNAALVIIGFVFLGRNFIAGTIYSSIMLAVFIWLLELVAPLSRPLTNDRLLELCFAVILPALGSGIVFNTGASTGGTDIVAMILSRHTSIEIGKALMATDFLITIAAGFMFGVQTGLYCILGLMIKALLLDNVIESINTRKLMTIISKQSKSIEDFIINHLHRGATVSKASGAYTHEEKDVITTVVGRRQAVALRNFIRTVDRDAFITIVNSSETVGKGFRAV